MRPASVQRRTVLTLTPSRRATSATRNQVVSLVSPMLPMTLLPSIGIPDDNFTKTPTVLHFSGRFGRMNLLVLRAAGPPGGDTPAAGDMACAYRSSPDQRPQLEQGSGQHGAQGQGRGQGRPHHR